MSYVVEPDARGRLLLPQPLREQLGASKGHKVVAELNEDGSVTLRHERKATEAAVAALKGIMAGKGPSVDEFLEERRREAQLEDEKERRLAASS
jgi:bifunctional DNA-binding transcriptional regulator/antitoxin component of YhaV-PrlF toxin-antitoxin module